MFGSGLPDDIIAKALGIGIKEFENSLNGIDGGGFYKEADMIIEVPKLESIIDKRFLNGVAGQK